MTVEITVFEKEIYLLQKCAIACKMGGGRVCVFVAPDS